MERPRFATVRDYGARLGDVVFWQPYVAAAMARHGLALHPLECGAVGTYPTLLVGPYVVKLFGPRFSGGEGYAVERTLHALFVDRPTVPAPRLIGHGTLFDGPLDDGVPWSDSAPDGGGEGREDWPWPYLITTRLSGTPWRTAGLDATAQEQVAHELGAAMRCVHELPVPDGAYWTRDWVGERRAGCVERHRRWGSLPPALIEQIDDYLDRPPLSATCPPSPPSPPSVTPRCLVHGDLHAEHVFIATDSAGLRLTGIIDWGDALACDPHYELPALRCGTFGGERRLLRAFLDGYGWTHSAGEELIHRAMTMTLLFEFNVLHDVAPRIAERAPHTLDEVARFLWATER